MQANRNNPGVGNTPIRAPTVREGLPQPGSKCVCRNPSLTVGALMEIAARYAEYRNVDGFGSTHLIILLLPPIRKRMIVQCFESKRSR